MGKEIERKFLVASDAWRSGASGTAYRQGYLSTDPARTVRIRIKGNTGILTIKGLTEGASRDEYEYEIPVEEAAEMLDNLCHRPIIDKTRYEVRVGEHVWEVDDFHGDNEGLIVAEIELGSEDEQFQRPEWVGDEVTGDRRYYNASLVQKPYSSW